MFWTCIESCCTLTEGQSWDIDNYRYVEHHFDDKYDGPQQTYVLIKSELQVLKFKKKRVQNISKLVLYGSINFLLS